MAIYQFKIVGVHYAIHPDSTSKAEETELMHQRTAQRLRELDEKRPVVVLIPEPTNPVDARAVMARVEGTRIGYVDKTQLDTLHAIFQANGGRILKATIEGVEARKHGWMNICLETKEDVFVESHNLQDSQWMEWTCNFPELPTTDPQFAQMEAEMMLEDALSSNHSEDKNTSCNSVVNLNTVEQYIRIWLDSSLHDLSNEARLMREHYIMRLKELMSRNDSSSQIAALVFELEKQRTAICGQKRMDLRANGWWKQLLLSKEMEQLWSMWITRIGGDLEQPMSEMDTLLRALPFDLYAFIDDKKLFFSRLHYGHVPRTQYWKIVSLMLLRERTLMEREGWGNETYPHMDSASRPQVEEEKTPDEPFTVTIPKELETPEAKKILARLQKKGMLDADLQPSTLVGWQKGILAYELTERLDIKHRWVVMARLWKCSDKTLRQNYSKNFSEQKAIGFSKMMKAMMYSV